MPVVINDLDVQIVDAPDPAPAPSSSSGGSAAGAGDGAHSPTALDHLHEAFARADRRARLVVE